VLGDFAGKYCPALQIRWYRDGQGAFNADADAGEGQWTDTTVLERSGAINAGRVSVEWPEMHWLGKMEGITILFHSQTTP